ncbi:MAG: hypothetical protein MJZ54_05705 [Bacteroidaceae bacterium]|nr:hypothetical protein [Bacteroidaceae bacterium]
MMQLRKDGLVVQTEREIREEKYRIIEAEIQRRLDMYERYYGKFVSQEERNDYYVYIDRKIRGKEITDGGFYPEAIREKMLQVRQLITELFEMGVDESVLADLIRPQRTLSRLYITHDYRIFLPEFNNQEVDLSPLPRAVFILFLHHPEGIVFKEIGDYFVELLSIYKVIMGSRFNELRARASLTALCDPMKNSLNEKCSRIREKFFEILSPDAAPLYCIDGVRSQPKRIMLPSALVKWEDK